MISLLIDTSSSDVSIAILKDEKLLSSTTTVKKENHSKYTVEEIKKQLDRSNLEPKDIERIMVVTGPGSFTGLRIGVTIAKVFAYLNKIEIIPISSLKMRALSTKHEFCLSIIDAHHDNYYVGLYDKDNKNIINEHFGTKEEVLNIIKEYKPLIVSDIENTIDNIKIPKQELDFSKIVNHYQKEKSLNPHIVNPNYLKKPQPLEGKND